MVENGARKELCQLHRPFAFSHGPTTSEPVRRLAMHYGNPPSKRQSETKYEPAIYMCIETTENGGLSKKNCCMHVSQVNYGKPSDCNKIVR